MAIAQVSREGIVDGLRVNKDFLFYPSYCVVDLKKFWSYGRKSMVLSHLHYEEDMA